MPCGAADNCGAADKCLQALRLPVGPLRRWPAQGRLFACLELNYGFTSVHVCDMAASLHVLAACVTLVESSDIPTCMLVV
eukprot:181393-Chlamydomonas_euryale.AAC.2